MRSIKRSRHGWRELACSEAGLRSVTRRVERKNEPRTPEPVLRMSLLGLYYTSLFT